MKRCSACKDASSVVIRCYSPAVTKHIAQDPLLHTMILHWLVERLVGIEGSRNILGQYEDLYSDGIVVKNQASVVLFLMDVGFISSLIPVDCCPDCDNLVFI